jgi:hypothetical protein
LTNIVLYDILISFFENDESEMKRNIILLAFFFPFFGCSSKNINRVSLNYPHHYPDYSQWESSGEKDFNYNPPDKDKKCDNVWVRVGKRRVYISPDQKMLELEEYFYQFGNKKLEVIAYELTEDNRNWRVVFFQENEVPKQGVAQEIKALFNSNCELRGLEINLYAEVKYGAKPVYSVVLQ